MKKYLLIGLICSIITSFNVFADNTDNETDSVKHRMVFKPFGYAAFQGVQLLRYKYKGLNFNHRMTVNSIVNFGLSIAPTPNFTINTGIEGYVWFTTIPNSEIYAKANELMTPNWSFYIHQSDMVYSFGNKEMFNGELGFGYFPFKYNPEVYNLGEYMFRSGTYPGWLITNFGWPMARLGGLRFSSTTFNRWKNDLLLTTEIEMYPYFDLSFSWLTSVKALKGFFDIGAGISFSRFIPNRKELTTPEHFNNIADIQFNSIQGTDTLYDTTYYTFQGTKAMARLTLDPKVFLPERIKSLFSEKGLKLYCELNILGLKNQGVLDSSRNMLGYFADIAERMPFVFGIHFPTFKILDVLACEFEYYKSPYPNDYGNQLRFADKVNGGLPVPYKGEPNTDYDISTGIYNKDNWKWSIYTERSIGKHFIIVGQIARDHRRTYSSFDPLKLDTEECLTTYKHWYWAAKIVSVF